MRRTPILAAFVTPGRAAGSGDAPAPRGAKVALSSLCRGPGRAPAARRACPGPGSTCGPTPPLRGSGAAFGPPAPSLTKPASIPWATATRAPHRARAGGITAAFMEFHPLFLRHGEPPPSAAQSASAGGRLTQIFGSTLRAAPFCPRLHAGRLGTAYGCMGRFFVSEKQLRASLSCTRVSLSCTPSALFALG